MEKERETVEEESREDVPKKKIENEIIEQKGENQNGSQGTTNDREQVGGENGDGGNRFAYHPPLPISNELGEALDHPGGELHEQQGELVSRVRLSESRVERAGAAVESTSSRTRNLEKVLGEKEKKDQKSDIIGKLRARSRKDKVSDLAEEKKSKRINTKESRAVEVERRQREDKQQKCMLEKWMTRKYERKEEEKADIKAEHKGHDFRGGNQVLELAEKFGKTRKSKIAEEKIRKQWRRRTERRRRGLS